MFDDDDEAFEGEIEICPHCDQAEGCEAVLLLVDLTFRTAEGGLLMDVFNERWSEACDNEDANFDEQAAFDALLETVDRLADCSFDYVFEGGPGMSSANRRYCCSNAERTQRAALTYRTLMN